MEAFYQGAECWFSLIYERKEENTTAKNFAACLMIQRLWEIITSEPERSFHNLEQLLKFFSAKGS